MVKQQAWRIGRETHEGIQIDSDGGTICTGVTWRPNAALIAAAPQLLAALKQALVVMESVAETHGYDTSIGAVPQAHAAIAHAEGQAANA